MNVNSGETVDCTGDDDCTCGSRECRDARRQRSNDRMTILLAEDDQWERAHDYDADTFDDGQEEIDLQRRCDALI